MRTGPRPGDCVSKLPRQIVPSLLVMLSLALFGAACSVGQESMSNTPASPTHSNLNAVTLTERSDQGPKVTITHPTADVTWRVRDVITVRWRTEGIASDAPVTIMLWDAMMKEPYPIGKTSNTGSFSWTVTDRMKGAHLRVSVHVAGVFDMRPCYVEIKP
jgi:hypothetical protein